MSLPPGFLDELRTRTSLSQVVGRKVIWDTRKSNQGKGDMWAPCPFHQEKTASFHVDDRQGFYYCFGCHAKGDAIGFVKETENVSFMEAVEILSREAGMPMPERDPQAQEKADKRTELSQVTEAAVGFFRLQLKTAAAQPARDYLARRGLDEAALSRFEVGFAPSGQQTAFQALISKGIPADKVIAADIARQPDDGRAPYDTFRDRIMFPIRDARGRCIAFGGRAMAADAQAKYLNSRETDLFVKGQALYNQGPSREAAGKGQPLIVAEGYMDVIALVSAGFEATVAPLGTAITEGQLRLMWRIADEPIIALDGDTAGLRAAMRLIDLALPMLEPGKSLRFCLMPDGQDPDDLIRSKGRAGMQAALDAAQPMVSLLWQRETEGRVFDSPERKAALDMVLRTAIAKIPDPSVRSHYGQALKDLRWQLFRPTGASGPRKNGNWRTPPVAAPRAGTKSSALAAGTLAETELREALILTLLCLTPQLIDRFVSDLERLNPQRPDHRQLVNFLLHTEARSPEAVEHALTAANLLDSLENMLRLGHVRITACVRNPGDLEKTTRCLSEEFAKLSARRGIENELAEALEDLDTTENSHLSWRLNHALQTRHAAETPNPNETADAGEDREALSNAIRELIDGKAWEKKNR
jgi:DNA primase